jgi:hypothetical protein
MYKTFIPQVYASPAELDRIPESKKGICLTGGVRNDVETLNSFWYYDWDSNPNYISDYRYTPMLWSGNISTNIPKPYAGEILFLNEANSKDQANKTPLQSFDLYRRAKDYYFLAKLIPGGMACLSEFWYWTNFLEEFLELFYKNNEKLPYRWHLHFYIESFLDNPQWNMTVDRNILLLKRQLFLLGSDKLIWVTEYGDVSSNLVNFKKLTEYFLNHKQIERIYPFGARLTGLESWFPKSWNTNMGMIKGDGSLTEIGKYYKEVK